VICNLGTMRVENPLPPFQLHRNNTLQDSHPMCCLFSILQCIPHALSMHSLCIVHAFPMHISPYYIDTLVYTYTYEHHKTHILFSNLLQRLHESRAGENHPGETANLSTSTTKNQLGSPSELWFLSKSIQR
jgi:hypothetical protein